MARQALVGRADVSKGRGRIMLNFAGNVRKSGGTRMRICEKVFARDSFVCQWCGKDCSAEQVAYQKALLNWKLNPRATRGPRPDNVVEGAHIWPFDMNGLTGLNAEIGRDSNGALVVELNAETTRADLLRAGLTESEVETALDVKRYEPCYDANNLETWCRSCNRTENNRKMPKVDALRRIARAKALNSRVGL